MKYSQYFEIAKRIVTDEDFIRLRDCTPKELTKLEVAEGEKVICLVREIHQTFNSLPNDWIHSVILEAFEALEETKIDDCNIETDVYNYDLLKWFYENGSNFSIELCNDYLENIDSPKDIIEIITGAQWLAKDRIYHAVNNFMEENE